MFRDQRRGTIRIKAETVAMHRHRIIHLHPHPLGLAIPAGAVLHTAAVVAHHTAVAEAAGTRFNASDKKMVGILMLLGSECMKDVGHFF